MYLISDPLKDHRHPKTTHGAYEWWYFDAFDETSDLGIVVIFYDGLLFSPDYHEAQEIGISATPDNHPGMSISVYKGKKTLYYALKSFPKEKTFFSDSTCQVKMGENTLLVLETSDFLEYQLILNDRLPNGLHLQGTLRFQSPRTKSSLASEIDSQNHVWNLIQAKAKVSGQLELSEGSRDSQKMSFSCTGYHDHNLGSRPLEEDFNQWYWGRLHLRDHTLVWYIMYNGSHKQQVAWLVRDVDGSIIPVDSIVMMTQPKATLFGLQVCHNLEIRIEGEVYTLKTDIIWDEGPFYLRYKVHLYNNEGNVVDGSSPGIAEYIKPDRISKKWVKPMIKTRYYREGTRANWIQRSLMLSKWTW